jgi:Zn-dependent peptidase ImmA (M78 family)/transcriptional regulator with XRE-family HTH domain
VDNESDELLQEIFGQESRGQSPLQRALTSHRRFVRSQDHLAVLTEPADGRTYSAYEALHYFGLDKLVEAVTYGSAVLPVSPQQPALSLRSRREQLGLQPRDVAQAAGVREGDVERAEDSTQVVPFRTLERLARVLGLDDSRLATTEDAGGDSRLALRLRTMGQQRPQFSSTLVSELADTAWIIGTQTRLEGWLGHRSRLEEFEPSPNYGEHGYPPWMHGYWLANETRRVLGLDELEPIRSLRELCFELGVPLIERELPKEFAGATLDSNGTRGIVVNVKGWNENVWVRRSTIAHELGHLLWDPAQKLESLKVDAYSELERAPWELDAVEARANAFAIEFLAPQAGVLEILRKQDDSRDVSRVMHHFGISRTAATYHVWNAEDRQRPIENYLAPESWPGDEWRAVEDLTLDYFPLKATPDARKGAFARTVVLAKRDGLISADSAASYLGVQEEEFESASESLLDLLVGA